MEVKIAVGRAQPVFLVVEKGEMFSVLKQRSDWLKIKTTNGDTGWVSNAAFFDAVGILNYSDKVNYLTSKWELGVSAGVFGSEESYGASAGYYLMPEVLLSADMSKTSGVYSSSTIGSANLTLNLYRRFIVSPFISIASGFMHNRPRQVLVNAQNNTQVVYSYGGGFNLNPYKNMGIRFSVRDFYLADKKQDYYDWRVGVFGVFY